MKNNWIGLFLVITIFFTCSRTGKKSTSSNNPDFKKDTLTFQSDYNSSLVFSSAENDNLLIESETFLDTIIRMRTQGKLIFEKEFGGGDCSGKVKIFYKNEDTLFIKKYNCGDYGFGNIQFLKKNDSILVARFYEYQWLVSENKTVFKINERLYNFGNITLMERQKIVEPWVEYSLKDIPFSTNTFSRTEKTKDFKKEIFEMRKLEKLEN
jgi:hypothetical protein